MGHCPPVQHKPLVDIYVIKETLGYDSSVAVAIFLLTPDKISF